MCGHIDKISRHSDKTGYMIQHYRHATEPIDLQFDSQLQKLYGIAKGKEGNLVISEYDTENTRRIPVIDTPGDVASVSQSTTV